jgi:hypothetical protein
LELLELSGGSLEQPKVVGIAVKDEGEDGLCASTSDREAYFVAFAGAVKAVAHMPVMVTGGFRSRKGMILALRAGELDVVGLGRPMIADPDIPKKLLSGESDHAPKPEAELDLFHIMSWFNLQLERLGDGLEPELALEGAAAAAAFAQLEEANLRRLMAFRSSVAA